jgi:hypothetical protein
LLDPFGGLLNLLEWARSLIKPAAPPAGAFFGKRLEDVQETEFFRWFSLVETSREWAGRRRSVVKFKPSGEKFHNVVTVELSLDGGGLIRGVRLLLARRFVDDAREGIYARDVTKSLLRAAVADAPTEGLKTLADEIEFRHDYPIIVGPGYQPQPTSPEPSPGFLTYLGRRGEYEQTFPGFTLKLENTADDEGPLLIISLWTP